MRHALYRLLKKSRLVMTMVLCETTIIKRLAWLVKQLIASSHELSSLFTLFSKIFSKPFHSFLIDIFTIFSVHHCFLLHNKFHLFATLFLNPLFKSLYFSLHSYFFLLTYQFHNHSSICFHIAFFIAFSTYHFLFFFLFFSLSLIKKN